jgi:acylphosphatase
VKIQSHLLVHGIVQGVGFRWFIKQAANQRGLTGFVRNLSDGGVEVVLEGEEEVVREMVAEVSRGPRWAEVSQVDVDERLYTGAYPNFSVRF